MEQKKKPPAGATLISRLREGRLKREQSLPVRQEVDFIRKEISIDELRPTSDDYELLTEEIRLAGRFAAVGLIAQGLRLARLKDEQIYKQGYSTFEEYCRHEHAMSATYAYRLMRMSEMAERLAEEVPKGVVRDMAASMPDPFQVMLVLGHRHLMALLPLETEAAEDLLLHGVPVTDERGRSIDRIPIVKATEKQLRQALSHMASKSSPISRPRQPQTVPSRRTITNLKDLVEAIEEWAEWLESLPEDHVLVEKAGDRKERAKLAQRMRTWAERVIQAL